MTENKSNDLHDLSRFVEAQADDYDRALAEIRTGRKETHWMWYIFPQFEGLGSSPMARRYAIKSRAEAEAYLGHPILGPRLIECARAVLDSTASTANEIFDLPDDLKLRSCMTLFAQLSPSGSAFHQVLAKYFAAMPDTSTVRLLRHER